MIPFNSRNNKLLYIHFRLQGLERENYRLKVTAENGEEYNTKICYKSLVIFSLFCLAS